MIESRSSAATARKLPLDSYTYGAGDPQQEKTAQANPQVRPATQSPSPSPKVAPNPQVKATTAPKTAARNSGNFSGVPFWSGMVLSIAWIGAVLAIMMQSGAAHTFGGIALTNWAIGISAVIAPVAFIWMVAAYLQRAADVQSVVEPLRRQLLMITGESGAAEVRIRRFNQAIREQLELLREARATGNDDFISLLQGMNTHRYEIDQFEQRSMNLVHEHQEIIRRGMQQVEQLLEDKFTMLRILDGKLAQSGDNVARNMDSVRQQVGSLLHEIESNASVVSASIEQAMRDSRILADTARAQETSLLGAAESAAGTMHELSGKIDANVARFLERAGEARGEAERLANALDIQVRSLEDFGNVMPSRIGEAESILRGVADRLYASEQMAREQAVNLCDKLSGHIVDLGNVLERFGVGVSEADINFNRHSMTLNGVVDKIQTAVGDMTGKLEHSVITMDDRTSMTINRFTGAADTARSAADAVASKMAEAAVGYENVVRQMDSTTSTGQDRLSAITESVTAQLEQFESLNKQSLNICEDVQNRASATVNTVREMLEKMAEARDSTAMVGNILTDSLREAVQQNESIVARISDAATMTVRAMGVAVESLCQQENQVIENTRVSGTALQKAVDDVAERARVAETTLRERGNEIAAIIHEVQGHMDESDSRIRSFALTAAEPVRQVIGAIQKETESGIAAISRYGTDAGEQLNSLQNFHARLAEMGSEVTNGNIAVLGTMEQLNSRFLAARAAQEDTVRSTLEQLSNVSERLQRELGLMGDRTSETVLIMQGAANSIEQQSQNLQTSALNSGESLHTTATTLQDDAAKIRDVLRQHIDSIEQDLSDAENRFSVMGDELNNRTKTAYDALNRVATHYNEVTNKAAMDFEARATQLDTTAAQAYEKVDGLSTAMAQQIGMLSRGTDQVETGVNKLLVLSSTALQQLNILNQKLVLTHDAVESGSTSTIARLDDVGGSFLRHSSALKEAAQNSLQTLKTAGQEFFQQAGDLHKTTTKIEEDMVGLNSTLAGTVSVVIRDAEQVTVAAGRMETASLRVQAATETARRDADFMASRFGDLAQTASVQLCVAGDEISSLANKVDVNISALGVGLSAQASALASISDKIENQYQRFATDGGNQKLQLVELFEQLAIQHRVAADSAEDTMSRLSEVLQKLRSNLDGVADKSQAAIDGVTTAGAGFADNAESLIQNAQAAEKQARLVLESTGTMRDQIGQLRATIQDEGNRTGGILNDLIGKLTTGNSALLSLSTTSEKALTGVMDSTTARTATLNTIMQEVAERQRNLTIALDSQRDVLGNLLDRLKLAHDEAASAAERGASRIEDSNQQIVQQMEVFDTQSQTTINNIRSLGIGFTEETEALSRQSKLAEQQAEAMFERTSSFHAQSRKLRETMQSESTSILDNLNGIITNFDAAQEHLRQQGEGTLQALDQSVSNFAALAKNNGDSLHNTVNDVVAVVTNAETVINTAEDKLRDHVVAVTAVGTVIDKQTQQLGEIFGNLLDRLKLAHDEAATTAERGADKIKGSSQQIVQQMEEFNTQSQATANNIRSLGIGFTEETEALSRQSKLAEQQAEAMFERTASFHAQSRTLRENMQSESASILDNLNGIITNFDAAREHLRQQGEGTLQALDQSVSNFAALAKNNGEALHNTVDDVASAVANAETAIATAGDKLRDHVGAVSAAGTVIDKQTKQLGEAAEYATEKMTMLSQKLTDSDREGREAMAGVGSRISAIRDTLYKELENVGKVSEEVVQRLAIAGGDLQNQSENLRSHLTGSEIAVSHAAMVIREDALQLPAVLNRSVEQIQDANTVLREQTHTAETAVISLADRFIGATGTIRDTMMDELRNLERISSTASEDLGRLVDDIATNTANMRQSSVALTAEQTAMAEKTKAAVDQLALTYERLTKMRTEVATLSEKLLHDFDGIDVRADHTMKKLNTASAGVTEQVNQLATATEVAEGKMITASQSFREQLEKVRSGVQMQIEDINRGLMQITAQMDRTSTTLRSASSGAVSDIEKISAKFDHTSKEATHQLTDRTARMRVATEDVAELLNGFGDQMDVLLNRLATAGDGIKRQENDLLGQLQTALGSMGSVVEKLEMGRNLAGEMGDNAVMRMATAAEELERHIKGMNEQAKSMTSVVGSVGRECGAQTAVVGQSVTEVQNQIAVMNQSISDMQNRADRLRVSLKLQGDDLLGSLEHILRQLATTGDAMEGTVTDTLRQQAESNLQRIG